MSKLPVTAIVLTFNEEIHIARCLSRIMPWVERVVVVDSFSTDRTVELARAHGAEVLQNAWRNSHAIQFAWAIDRARPTTPWILRLDADEYFEEPALAELAGALARIPDGVAGIQWNRKFIFQGRWIRHGRYYPVIQLRLFRTDQGSIEQRWMDEQIVVSGGTVAHLRGGDLVDHNLNDIGWWTTKHNGYATRHMVDFINREHALFVEDRRVETGASTASRRRFLKTGVYGRAPLYWRAFAFYVYRYVFRLGFLDGREGLLFHFLHGFWLMMLIDAKIDEARRFIRAHGLEAFRQDLKTRHGIEL